MNNFYSLFKDDLGLACLSAEEMCNELYYKNITLMFNIPNCVDSLIAVGQTANLNHSNMPCKVFVKKCTPVYTVYFISDCKFSIQHDVNNFDIKCTPKRVQQNSIKIVFVDRSHMTETPKKMEAKRLINKMSLSEFPLENDTYIIPMYSTQKALLYLDKAI